jgi:putative addiction module component (TIGR02574 family)
MPSMPISPIEHAHAVGAVRHFALTPNTAPVTICFTDGTRSGIMNGANHFDEPTMKQPLQEIDYTTLSPTERLILVQDILDSVVMQVSGDVLTPDQIAEVERRAADLADGTLECVPWEQARSHVLRLT